MWEGVAIVTIVIIILIIIGIILLVFLTRPSTGGLNDPCTTGSDCIGGYTCTGSVCKATIGTACGNNGDCATNLMCTSGICIVPPTLNQQNGTTPTIVVPTIPIRAPEDITENDCMMTEQDSDDIIAYNPRSDRQDISISMSGDISRNIVIDICSYSDSVIYLHSSCTLVREYGGKRDSINNYIDGVRVEYGMIRIESFAGYLYCVFNGRLHQLDNRTFESCTWTWIIVSWCNIDVIHTSHTLDERYLWVQSSEVGYLYDTEFNVKKSFKALGRIRVYGNSIDRYIDIDQSKEIAYVMPGKKRLTDVIRATITYHGEIIALGRRDLSTIADVRLVNWKPYYIKR